MYKNSFNSITKRNGLWGFTTDIQFETDLIRFYTGIEAGIVPILPIIC